LLRSLAKSYRTRHSVALFISLLTIRGTLNPVTFPFFRIDMQIGTGDYGTLLGGGAIAIIVIDRLTAFVSKLRATKNGNGNGSVTTLSCAPVCKREFESIGHAFVRTEQGHHDMGLILVELKDILQKRDVLFEREINLLTSIRDELRLKG
jgi:hypothetical protein